MELWSSLLCLLLFCTLIHTLFSVSKSSKSKRLPPGPIPYPIIGNLLKLGNKPHKSLAQLAKVHGPIMSLKLGHITTVVISSAPIAREILQIQDLYFSTRTIPESLKAHNHDQFSVAWLPPTTQWRNLRKISNTLIFTTQKLDANQHLRRKKIDELLAHVQKCCEAGRAADIGKAAFVTTLNLLSNTLFSIDLVSPNSDAAQEYKGIISGMMEETGKPNLADYFPVLKKIDPQGIRRKMSYYYGKMFQIFDKFIDERLKSRKTYGSLANVDVLDILLNLQQESQEIDMTHIKHLLLDLIVAGTDTSSHTLEWAMAELLCNPGTLSRAQEELNQVMGKNNSIQESDISNLPYLQAIVKETFRLHAVVPFLLPRKVDKDQQVCGFTVPKNAQVLVNVWAIGRDPSIWENPNCFVPERFLGSQVDFRGRNFELIPFGAGRRICPGMPLAMRMIYLMLGSLIHSFDWKVVDGAEEVHKDMDDKFGLSLQKAKPLLAVPITKNA